MPMKTPAQKRSRPALNLTIDPILADECRALAAVERRSLSRWVETLIEDELLRRFKSPAEAQTVNELADLRAALLKKKQATESVELIPKTGAVERRKRA